MTMQGNDFSGSPDFVKQSIQSAATSSESYWQPSRVVISAWLEHAPFAFWIMNAISPATLVELGTHNGFSFFTFCEAARRLRLPTRCFAIDTWQGDDHAGFYGDEIYADVSGVATASYPDSAVLLRGYFDDFVHGFDDASIDLLHIDGRHSYEDVKHDFESWLPKVADGGIVLFHDIAEHERGFGVWQLWEEVAQRYPHFSFKHGHGLGVLGVGTQLSPALKQLFDSTDDAIERVRSFYSDLGELVSARYSRDVEEAAIRVEIASLRASLGELTDQLAELRNSYSWRMTRPLRKAAAAIPSGGRHMVRSGVGKLLGAFRR